MSLRGLADLTKQGVISEKDASRLRGSLGNQIPVLIVGGTATGKTTLGRALLPEIHSEFDDRYMTNVISWGHDGYPYGDDEENRLRVAQLSNDFNESYQQALRMRPEIFLVDEIDREKFEETVGSFIDASGFVPVVGVLHGHTTEGENEKFLENYLTSYKHMTVIETSRDEDGHYRAKVIEVNK